MKYKLLMTKHHCHNYSFDNMAEMFVNKFVISVRSFADEVDLMVKSFNLTPEKIVIDMWSGSNDYFYVKVQLKGIDNPRGLAYQFKKKHLRNTNTFADYKLGYIQSSVFTDEIVEDYRKKTEKYMAGISAKKFARLANNANLNTEDTNNTVQLVEFLNYKKTNNLIPITGSIYDIFDIYTTRNDRLKYCNGHYYEFADPNVAELYSYFVNNYKGNYFLDNAVRRGCIID